jgi:thioredoxin reductase
VRKVRKERLLELWTAVARRHRLAIRYGERVERVQPTGGGFEVESTRGRYAARAVLLAIGRRGSPRKLGVPGEHLSKVVYSLVDPAQYRGSRVLVVGGGDSALEAAANLAAERNVEVILCYRGAVFSRARAQNRQRIEAADAQRRVRVLYDSTLLAIHPHHVDLTVAGQPYRTPNDAVIICAGGIMPGAFLREIGVDVETKYGAA